MDRFFGFIIQPMEGGLVWLAANVPFGGAGVGIILFTVLVRAALSPLQIVQLRSAKAMQRLQPHIAELRKKHGKDKQKLSQETMALYKEHRVNPAMGCAPTLLQFPILIGLFYALVHLGASPPGYPGPPHWPTSCNGYSGVASWHSWFQHCYVIKNAFHVPVHRYFSLFHAPFLWLNHGLGKPDPLYILPVLAGITQWVQSRMMLVRSTDPQQQMMNTMTNFFPLMIVFFATQYSSGLSLYWVTSTTIGILIQYRITGWGLLPETLNKTTLSRLPALLLNPSGSSQSRSRRDRPKPAANKQQPRVEQSTEPVTDTEIAVDGSDGASKTGAEAGSVTRPRRKAGRSRGGRSGRRG